MIKAVFFMKSVPYTLSVYNSSIKYCIFFWFLWASHHAIMVCIWHLILAVHINKAVSVENSNTNWWVFRNDRNKPDLIVLNQSVIVLILHGFPDMIYSIDEIL